MRILVTRQSFFAHRLLFVDKMAAKQAIRKLLLPAAAVVGASSAAGGGHNSGSHCVKCTQCNCRPSQLPIYPIECSACKVTPVEKPTSEIESAIRKARSELWVYGEGIQGYKTRVNDFIQTGIAHSSSTIDILREESNGPERGVAIGVASLSGLIFGLRGGFFKRVTYASIGGLSMAAVCYPRQAAEYSQVALEEANKYFVQGYHFVFGESPKLPDWAASAWESTQKKIKEVTSKQED